MKGLVIGLIFLLLGSPVSLFSASIGGFIDDVREETKLTILQSATPAYFYNVDRGQSLGGVITPVIEYRFLSADTGWIHGFEDRKLGTALLGGSVHIDKLMAQYFPNVTTLSQILIPKSMEKFWDKLQLGFWGGHDLDSHSFTYGLYSGLKFEF